MVDRPNSDLRVLRLYFEVEAGLPLVGHRGGREVMDLESWNKPAFTGLGLRLPILEERESYISSWCILGYDSQTLDFYRLTGLIT